MSQETTQWLNSQTLIGFVEKRGKAWHYRASDQGAESNHYEGAVPLGDVKRRLFNWKPVEGDLVSNVILPDGVLTVRDPDRKTIVRPDTEEILGIFKKGYKIHDYEEWLLNNVGLLLDDDLAIGSAGLLKKGAVAWVSVEVPESITTPEGVTFRPNLLAATSLDGSLSTTYQRVVTLVVCDNTLSCALGESGQRVKIKHSRNSIGRLTEAREALAIVHSIGDDFATQVADLTAVKVDDSQFRRFLDKYAEVPEEKGRGRTIAINKHDTLMDLWKNDPRVAPWKNTAFGVVQAINTAVHHEFTVRGETRADRNALRAVTGGVDSLDAETLRTLNEVLA